MKDFLIWAFFGVFLFFLILVDLLNQKRNPPVVKKGKNKDGETEYAVNVKRMSKRGGFYSTFVFAHSAWEGRLLPKFSGEFMWGGILLGGLTVCSVVFPLFAGFDLESEYLGIVAMLFLIEFTAFALVELRAVLRAYRALKKYLQSEME